MSRICIALGCLFSATLVVTRNNLSAIIHPTVPIAWAARVMSQGKNNDSHVIGAIHKRKVPVRG